MTFNQILNSLDEGVDGGPMHHILIVITITTAANQGNRKSKPKWQTKRGNFMKKDVQAFEAKLQTMLWFKCGGSHSHKSLYIL